MGEIRMPHVSCPACGGKAYSKAVGKHSLLFRELYYKCRNPDACGHEFVVEMTAVRTVRPTIFPLAKHRLPMTTWLPAANDRAANDDGAPPPPADAAVTQ
ncbi:ogr/Delta-like zinc finger family protein [Sphingobium sp. AS12]|nr:ogr/Delta-like zinc finger family protein [Sphingobium sp. AS12]